MNNPYLQRKLEDAHNYYGSSYSNRYCNWKRYLTIYQLLKKFLSRRKNSQVIKILEIGCSDGWAIYRLKAAFSKDYSLYFTGVDLSALDIDFAQKRKEYYHHQGCEFAVMDAGKLDFPDEQFDIVLCSEVVEHIEKPQIVIAQLYRVLRPGGLCLITTPRKNGSFLSRLGRFILRGRHLGASDPAEMVEVNELVGSRFGSADGITGAGHEHISVFSVQQWLTICKDAGWKIQTVKGTGGLFFGSPAFDRFRIIFALSMIIDTVMEKTPWSSIWSETLVLELRK